MKKILLFIALLGCLTSCKQEEKKHAETASFFTTKDKSISLGAIEKNWNERLKKENVEAHITNIEIKQSTDKKTRSSPMILLGTTNLETVKTACVLIPFHKGYQLGNSTVTCVNCEKGTAPYLYDGKWACQNMENHSDKCKRIISEK